MRNVHLVYNHFNRPVLVSFSLASVFAQEYKDITGKETEWNLKIYVVDDNSNDENFENVKELLDEGPFKNWLHRTNVKDEERHLHARYAVCINLAIDEIRKDADPDDLVMYFCDDNIWYPNKVSTVVNAFDMSSDSNIIHNGTQLNTIILDAENYSFEYDPAGTRRTINCKFEEDMMLKGPEYNHIDHQSLTHTVRLFDKIKQPYWIPDSNCWNHGDYMFWMKLYKAYGASAFHHLPVVLDEKWHHAKNAQFLVKGNDRWAGISAHSVSRDDNFE